MKKRYALSILFLGMLFILGIPLQKVSAKETDRKIWYDTVEDKYLCPISKSTEEWKLAENVWERKQLLNIPNGIIQDISTENLLDMVLKYEYIGDIFYYNSYQDAIETIARQYNGLEELLTRSDSGLVILNYLSNNKLEETYESIKENIFLEILLSQPSVINTMSEYQKNDLVNVMQEREKKKQNITFCNEIENIFFECIDQNGAVYLFNDDTIENITLYASSLTLKTPKGTSFTMQKRTTSDEHTPSMLTYIMKDYYDNYGDFTTLRETATNLYNCHYYTWINRSGNYPGYMTKTYWLSNPYDFIEDKSYVSNGMSKPSAIGQFAVYYASSVISRTNVKHSAYVLSTGATEYSSNFISKWGDGPLVEHSLINCPYYTGTVIYYKKGN